MVHNWLTSCYTERRHERQVEQLFISFAGKKEYILNEGICEERPIGALLFAFLDFLWHEAERELLDYRERVQFFPVAENSVLSGDFSAGKNYLAFAPVYQKICGDLEQLHPLLGQVVSNYLEKFLDEAYPDMPVMAAYGYQVFRYYPASPVSPEEINEFAMLGGFGVADKVLIQATNRFAVELLRLCRLFQSWQQDLLQMIDFALDSEGQYAHLPTEKRYYLMAMSGFPPYARSKDLLETVKIKHKLLSDWEGEQGESEIDEKLLAELERTDVSSHTFYIAEDIRSLVMLEFDYLCSHRVTVRKCFHCGKYFLPVSQRAIYCSRVLDDSGKACKDMAAAVKYRESVNRDEAKKYYQRLNNAYQMRCRRTPALFPQEDHWQWQDMAKALLKKVEAGELSLEGFKEQIALPKLK